MPIKSTRVRIIHKWQYSGIWLVIQHVLEYFGSIDFGQWEETKKYGTELVEGYTQRTFLLSLPLPKNCRLYYGFNHPLFGLFYLKLGKLLVYLEEDTQALAYFKKANEFLKITHGTSSVIFKELKPLIEQVNGCYVLK